MKGKITVPRFTHERLLEVLEYNPNLGELKWKVTTSKNVKAGMLAGSTKGYVTVDKEEVTIARVAWFYMTGDWPKRRIGFKNKNIHDFRFCNLYEMDGLDGFDHKSRSSRIAYQREFRKIYPIKYKEGDLKYNFGITLAEYSKMIADQDNKCAICGQPETHKRNGRIKALAVDHCHTTGKIRGLLCSDCNTGIGKMKDDPQVLRKAAEYLENSGYTALQTGPTDAAQTSGRNLVQEV